MIRLTTVFAISVLISLLVGFVDYLTGAQISMLLLSAPAGQMQKHISMV